MSEDLPPLGPFLRDTLIARHGSLPAAAEKHGVSYERLKKSIQRSRFAEIDLEILLPERSCEELKAEFSFELTRRHSVSGALKPGNDKFTMFAELEAGLRSYQRGVRETNFNKFVGDIYENIGNRNVAWIQSMVLFCHETSKPVEWEPENIHLLKKLAEIVCAGGTVIYVMEIDLENSVMPDNDIVNDNIDRQFRRRLDRLKIFCDEIFKETGEAPKGYVALIRAPRCSFCIPFQKPALFSRYAHDGEGYEHYALTTVEIPERIDGKNILGTAVLPLPERTAYAMQQYVFELERHIRSDENKFHFLCFPEEDNAQFLLEKLKPLVEL